MFTEAQLASARLGLDALIGSADVPHSKASADAHRFQVSDNGTWFGADPATDGRTEWIVAAQNRGGEFHEWVLSE